MSDRYFLDTNIIVYAYDNSAPRKQSTSRNIILKALRDRSGSISSQVISEFAVSAEKKMKMNPVEILQAIHLFSGFSCSDISLNLTVAAWKRHIKCIISYWDSLIIEAALSEQCSILYSEDMNHGQIYDGLTVINPFLE